MAAKSVIATFVSKALVAILGLLLVVLVSRSLGAEGRGEVSIITSGMALILIFCEFVSGSALINLSYTKSQTHLFLSGIIWSALMCLLAFVVLLVLPFIHTVFILHLPLLAFLLSVITIGNALLMGRKSVKARNMLLVLQPLLVLLTALLLFRLWNEISVQSYIIALYAGLVITLAVSLLLQFRALSVADLRTFRFDKSILRLGFRAQLGHLVQFLNYRLSFFIIAWLIGRQVLGVYNNAIVLTEALWMFGHSLGQIQHMQVLNAADERTGKAVTLRYLHLCVPVTAVLLLCVLCLPGTFWTWLFGPDFSQMKSVLLYLSPAVLCFSVSVILNHYFHAKNRFGTIILANLFGLLTGTMALFLLLIPFGILGAAISAGVCHLAIMSFYLYTSVSEGIMSLREIFSFSHFRSEAKEFISRILPGIISR